MTRIVLVPTLLTLVLLPLATAGPGATVSTLEDRGASCASDSWWWSDGNWSEDGGWSSYGSGGWHECSSSYEYAGVAVDDHRGEAARVSVQSTHDNRSSGSWSSYEQWYNGAYSTRSSSGSSAWTEDWSRSANASTRAGDASAGYGCSRDGDASSYESAYSSYEGYGSWSDGEGYRFDNGCGTSANALGDRAYVGDRCSWSEDEEGHHNSWGDGSSSSHRTTRYANGCFTGAETSAGSAGYGSTCAGRDHSTAYGYGEEWYGWYDSHQDCAYGVVLTTSDGALLFTGYESGHTNSCDWSGNETQCYGESGTALSSRLSWEHNPLGPGTIYILRIPLV